MTRMLHDDSTYTQGLNFSAFICCSVPTTLCHAASAAAADAAAASSGAAEGPLPLSQHQAGQ